MKTNLEKMEELLSGEIQPKRVYAMYSPSRFLDCVHTEIVFPAFIDSAYKRIADKLPVLFSYGSSNPITLEGIANDINSSLEYNQKPLGVFVFDLKCLGDDHGESVSGLKDIALKYNIPVIIYQPIADYPTRMTPEYLVGLKEWSDIGTRVIENADVIMLFNREESSMSAKVVKNRMVSSEVNNMEFTIKNS